MDTRRIFVRALPCALLAALGIGAGAAAAPPALKMLTIGIAPYGMLDRSGRPAGIFVEISDKLARESGLRFENHVVPYPRAIAMLASGEADLLFAFPSAQLERSAHQVFSTAIGGEVIIVGLPNAQFHSLADLHGKVVGHIRGTNYDAAFMADSAIGKRETVTMEQTVKMLLEGRFDAVIGTNTSLYYALRELGLARHRLGPALRLDRREAWLHFSNKSYDPAVAEKIRRAALLLREQGVFDVAMRRYTGGLPLNECDSTRKC